MSKAPHVWLCSACINREDETYYIGSIATDGICARCGGLAMEVYLPETQEPHTAMGTWMLPSTCSTSVAIERFSAIVWDVNGYYRDLGVATDASRKEIRMAYQRKEGWRSTRLTYVVKQLLHPKVRSSYDRCRPGTIFFDRYWREKVEREIQKDLSRLAGTGDGVAIEDKTERIQLPPEDEPFDVVDRDAPEVQNGFPGWRWRYFLWQSGSRDTKKLARWQEHLVRVFSERRESLRIGVGFLGAHMGRAWDVREVGPLTVVFLSDNEEPSAVLANEAADRVVVPQHQSV